MSNAAVLAGVASALQVVSSSAPNKQASFFILVSTLVKQTKLL